MKTETSNGFTAVENAAVVAFEQANESQDLRAFGNGRRERAYLALAKAYRQIEALDLLNALTVDERANGRSAVERTKGGQ